MKLNFKHLEILRKAAGGFKVSSGVKGNALEKKRILELSEAGLIKLEAVDPEFHKEGYPPRYRSLRITLTSSGDNTIRLNTAFRGAMPLLINL